MILSFIKDFAGNMKYPSFWLVFPALLFLSEKIDDNSTRLVQVEVQMQHMDDSIKSLTDRFDRVLIESNKKYSYKNKSQIKTAKRGEKNEKVHSEYKRVQ